MKMQEKEKGDFLFAHINAVPGNIPVWQGWRVMKVVNKKTAEHLSDDGGFFFSYKSL